MFIFNIFYFLKIWLPEVPTACLFQKYSSRKFRQLVFFKSIALGGSDGLSFSKV